MLSVPVFRKGAEFDYISAATQGGVSTTYTFAGVSFGAAAPTRRIHVMVNQFGDNIVSVTVGGVGATQNAQAFDAVNFEGASIWTALVPTGATGNIVINTGATGTAGMGIGWCRSTKLSSDAALDTFSGTGGGVFSDTLTATAKGFAIGSLDCSGAGVNSWTGITKRADTPNAGGQASVAADKTTGTSVAITATGSGSARAAAFASFSAP